MKISIAQSDLNAGLKRVSHASKSRVSIPALTSVLMEAKDRELALTATNLELQISHRVPATIHKAGTVLIPTQKISGLVSKLNVGGVDIEPNGAGVAIKSGSVRANLPGIDPKGFATKMAANGASFTIKQGQLRRMLARVAPSMSTDTTRRLLVGVQFEIKGLRFTVIATDGRRAAFTTYDLDAEVDNPDCIVPSQTVSVLLSLLDDSDEMATVICSSSFIEFQFGKTTLVSKRIEGDFPNWRRVIPQEADGVMLPREEVISAIRLAQTVHDEKRGPICVLTFDRNSLGIGASIPESEVASSVALEWRRPALKITINSEFLISALNAAVGDQVRMEVMDELSPVVVKESDFVAVISVMRTS